MANMFNKKTDIGGSFKANEMTLTFAGAGAGYLITSIDAGFNVTVSRFRELGSTRTYFIEGDSSGSLRLGQVVGPANSIVPLVRAYSDVCGVAQNVINLNYAGGSCAYNSGGAPNLSFSGVIISSYNMNATSTGAMTSSATMAGTFESVDSDDSSGGGVSGVLNSVGNIAAAAGL